MKADFGGHDPLCKLIQIISMAFFEALILKTISFDMVPYFV